MAPENNNWLSFSLSSMEMLNSSSSSSSMLQSNAPSAPTHQYYFADNFYPHGKVFFAVNQHFLLAFDVNLN